MESGMLAYKRQKGTVTAADYIAWSHTMLVEGNESSSLLKLSALTKGANIFEIESYFQQASNELGIQLPTLNSKETIQILAEEIIQATDDKKVAQLAQDIFYIVAELNYPDNLLEWYEISEMQDRLQYDHVIPPYTQQDVLEKIKETARNMQ